MRIHLLVLLVLFSLLVACGPAPHQTEKADESAPVPVQATPVAPAEWPLAYEAFGTVRASTASTISSRVMGYVRDVKVEAGDRVQEGQLLVSIDARDLEAGFRQAEAARSEAQSAISEVENAVAAASANLELAQVTTDRMKDLFEKKSISNQELDEASARLKGAQANYEMAQSKREQLSAKIEQAEQGYNAARIALGYAQITAPFSGTVTEKRVEPGVLAAPGTPLLTIEREGVYRLEAAVEESRLPEIRTGQAVTVNLDALDRSLQARVSEIVPAVDAASRTYTVKINLPAVSQLRSGMFGRAIFSLGTRNVLAVPAAALSVRGQLQSVLTVQQGVARARLITAGEKIGDQVEILSGLNSGDVVIFPLPEGLSDGARVEVRP